MAHENIAATPPVKPEIPMNGGCANPPIHPGPKQKTAGFGSGDSEAQPMHVYVGRLLSRMDVLWARRRLICGLSLLTMVAVFGTTFLIPNRYTAVAVVNPVNPNPLSGLAMAAMMKGDGGSGLGSQLGGMLGVSSPGQKYIRMMQTRRVEDMLIEQFGLQKVYGTAKPNQARAALAAASAFSVDRKSNVIEIRVTDRDPNRAAQLANGYAAALETLSTSLASESGGQERAYFETQLAKAEDDLQAATDRLSRYGRQNAALDMESGSRGIADTIGNLQGEIVSAQARLRGMRAVYAEDNEHVRGMEAQIAELKRQMAALGGPAAAAPRGDGSAGPSLAHLWSTTPQYLDLYGQVKLKSAMVETLAQQYELARLQETHRVSGVQLLDPALPPTRKSGPRRGLIGLAAGVLAFGLLCGWVLAKDWWSGTCPGDPWRALLQPRLAALASGISLCIPQRSRRSDA